MKPIHHIVAAALLALFVPTFTARGQQKPTTSPYFEQDVAASNPLRTQQAKGRDVYINLMKRDSGRLRALFKPDYSSPEAFEKSAGPLRKAFCDSIGYP